MLWGGYTVLPRMKKKKTFIKNKILDHFLVLGSTEIEFLLVDNVFLLNKRKWKKEVLNV